MTVDGLDIQVPYENTVDGRTFDRVQHFDERSRGFRAAVGIDTNPLRSYTWSCEAWNDQGQEGACVGFAWSHELTARPYPVPSTNALATKIYKRAQFLDPWPGENYSGTSVLAGAKATQEEVNAGGLTLLQEYRWAFGINDLLLVLGYRGPVVVGSDWYTGMYNTNSAGFIVKTGSIVGGHAYLARGFKAVWVDKYGPRTYANLNLDQSYVLIRNSWGQTWGSNGDAKISVSDLASLLSAGGDACVPVLRRK